MSDSAAHRRVPDRPSFRRGVELSGSLGRSTLTSRSSGAINAQKNGLHPVIRCRAGVFPLVFDLRDLLLVGRDQQLDPPRPPCDLAEVLGTSSSSARELVTLSGPEGERIDLRVDSGIDHCWVDLSALRPFPRLLHAIRGLTCLRGVIEIEGELHFLIDPRAVVRSDPRG